MSSFKFNVKLKGINHTLREKDAQHSGFAGSLPGTMVLGADVTHPGRESEGCPSLAAVVGTVDDFSGKYLASARLQPGREEVRMAIILEKALLTGSQFISDLRSMVKERVNAWILSAWANEEKMPMPETFLFYRDGVSESQYGMVKEEELPQIRDGCWDAFFAFKAANPDKFEKAFPAADQQNDWAPRVVLIVATKRHHTRFYPIYRDHSNTTPRKLIETEVVSPRYMDFYLQSHHSKLGTARSSHYIVIENAGFSLDFLQDVVC